MTYLQIGALYFERHASISGQGLKLRSLPVASVQKPPEKNRRMIIVLAIVFSILLALGYYVPRYVTQPDGPTLESDVAARTTDIRILAKELDLDVTTVEKSITFQEAFDLRFDSNFQSDLDQLSAVWVDPVPATSATIVFVGAVPAKAERLFAEMDVTLQAGGMISQTDHDLRAALVHAHLEESGLDNFGTAYIPTSDRIEIDIPQAVYRNLDEVERLTTIALRTELDKTSGEGSSLGGPAAVLNADDITFVERPNKALDLTTGRGGNKIYSSSRGPLVNFCTTAFSVRSRWGNGILSAGHCSGIDKYYDPKAPSGSSTTWAHRSTGFTDSRGDVAIYATGHSEVGEFHADANRIRRVSSVRANSQMTGRSVCHYGRKSNSRTCNHVVQSGSKTITSEGNRIGQQRAVTNPVSQKGDSGGGWSWSTTAWGITTGNSSNFDYFTPVTIATYHTGATVITG